MARKPRIHYSGAVYHVILRGNAGAPVFYDDRDRCRMYLFLQYAVEKFGCLIHGFCFMTNHIHLIVQVGAAPLSRVMQNVSLRYTKWINSTQGRTGHLFQGRYKALLIDADAYLLELVRYIHLNPVRAGAAAAAGDWTWSGHRAYSGCETIPWMTTGWVLGMLSPDPARARKAYLSFVDDGMSEGRRAEFHSGTCEGRLLGDDRFINAALGECGEERSRITVAEVLDAVCRVYGCSPEELRAPGKARPFTDARGIASLIVRESPQLSLTRLGKELERDIAPLGRAGQRVESRAREDKRLRELLEKVRNNLKEWQKG